MMFINFKLALRNFLKRKHFVFTNIFGLTIGVTSCILIFLFVHHEHSYDTFFDDADSIYRMVEERKSPGELRINAHVPYSFVRNVVSDYPEVESGTAVAGPFSNQNVSVLDENDQKISFLENHVLIADSNFFKVLDFKWIQGDKRTALKNPNSVVLSQSTARRFFGNQNPLGKPISIGQRSSVVTGVCQDAPSNSHFKFSYIVSSTTVKWFSQEHFNLRYAKCYFKLKPQASPDALEHKFPKMVETYLAGEVERIHKISWEAHKKAGNGYNYYLRPLTSVHLDPAISDGMKAGGNLIILRVLSVVGLLILTIACINFANLSTAQSMVRAREVGVRKVLGSRKYQLISQFLVESFIVGLISVMLAVCLTLILLPSFNTLFDTNIHLTLTFNAILSIVCLTIMITLFAGLYPAIVLSEYKPVSVLKGKFTSSKKGSSIQNGLVGFQFWITTMLIICTLVFQEQIHFLENKDLGFNKDQLVVVEGTFHMDANYTKQFLEEAKNISGVKETAGTLWVPGFKGTWSDEYETKHSTEVHTLRRVPVGDRFAEIMDFELLEGTFFSEQSDDEHNVLLNQAAVDLLALENPVGESIHMITHDDGNLEKTTFEVVGVIKNFNYQTLRNQVEPLVLQSNETVHGRMSYILVKIDGSSTRNTLELLEKKWKENVPDRGFTYRFLDETLATNYQNEKKLTAIFTLFCGLSIVLAGVGLFGLSAFCMVQRTKEIGIRKVLGGSVTSILMILSKDFIVITLIAFVLATPLSWYAMESWLQDFAYRINIPIGSFLIAGIGSILICGIAISSQAIKASLTNPIESLKDE